MTMCGEEVERYDTVANEVPFVRIATYCERKLQEAERHEQMLEELRHRK